MLASQDEIFEAKEEGIEIINSLGPKEVKVDANNNVTSILLKKCTQTIDPTTKKFAPLYDEKVTCEVKCDEIIFAIGQTIEWGKLLEGTGVTYWHGHSFFG